MQKATAPVPELSTTVHCDAGRAGLSENFRPLPKHVVRAVAGEGNARFQPDIIMLQLSPGPMIIRHVNQTCPTIHVL